MLARSVASVVRTRAGRRARCIHDMLQRETVCQPLCEVHRPSVTQVVAVQTGAERSAQYKRASARHALRPRTQPCAVEGSAPERRPHGLLPQRHSDCWTDWRRGQVQVRALVPSVCRRQGRDVEGGGAFTHLRCCSCGQCTSPAATWRTPSAPRLLLSRLGGRQPARQRAQAQCAHAGPPVRILEIPQAGAVCQCSSQVTSAVWADAVAVQTGHRSPHAHGYTLMNWPVMHGSVARGHHTVLSRVPVRGRT
jgi:hypothetical protein